MTLVETPGAAGGGAPGRLSVAMVCRLFAPWVGGTERQAEKLAVGLTERGVKVTVFTGRWFRATPADETRLGVRVIRHSTLYEFFGIRGFRRLGGYLYMLTLHRQLRRHRDEYDLIHVHGFNYHTAVAVRAGNRFGKPVVVKLANSGEASDLRRMREGRQLAGSRFLMSRALKCDAFVALNPLVVEELVAEGVEPGKVHRIPNGVGRPHPVPRPPDDGRQVVLFVGRLHPQKNLPLLLEAMASLEDRPILRVVGDGPQRVFLEKLARDLGIEVEFVGEVDDVAPWLAGADCFVLPSRVEGLSNALLEAMAQGLAVIASDIPGNSAVIRDGHEGILIPAGDRAALTTALDRVLSDEKLRGELGDAARRRVETDFGMDHVVSRYLDLYAGLLAEGREEVRV